MAEELVEASIDFHSLIATRNHTDSSLEELIDDLPNFTNGTAENPGRGIEQLHREDSEDLKRRFFGGVRTTHNNRTSKRLKDNATDQSTLELLLDESENDTTYFKYIYETYRETEADVDGERRSVHIPEKNAAIGNWLGDEFLLLNARPTDASTTFEDLESRLNDRITFEEIELDPDFILWIIYKLDQDKSLTPHIDVLGCTHARYLTSGGSSKRIRTIDMDHIDITNIIAEVLSGGDIGEAEFIFESNDVTYSVMVSTFSSLGVRCIVPKEIQNEGIKICSILSKTIIDLYSNWQNLSPKEKYPPISYFVDKYSEVDDMEIEDKSKIDDVLEEYTLKRTEEREPLEDLNHEAAVEDQMANPMQEVIYEDMTIGDALEIVESEVLEAKRSLPDQVDDIAKEIAALANTRGGALILGMDDNGELTGLSEPRTVEERAGGVISQSIEPLVNTQFMRRSIGDADLLIIMVEEARQTPRSVNGKYYKRVGTTTQELGPEELTQMIHERNQ